MFFINGRPRRLAADGDDGLSLPQNWPALQ
jgi:hypothetical protein